MKKRIKIAVVDDQRLFRKGLISLISEFDELDVIIDASGGRELIEMMKIKKPDVVLLDIQMPEMDGILVAEHLQYYYPEIKVLILSMNNDEGLILHLLERGARGFLLKDNDIVTVVDAIFAVIENGYYFNDRVSKAMVRELVGTKQISPIFNITNFSEREIEIIKLICQELTNKEIATKLFISKRTVDGHKEKILRKINAKNAIGIVMFAVKNNLLG
ncbi:MAG: response regulator [Bacteroidia bacterium]